MVLFVIAYTSLLATFNETFLNVALTPIMSDLNVDANTVQWVATAYMLCAAIMVPITGFLYRSIRTRRLFVAALCFLLVGTVVGIVAPSFPLLLVARVIQAIGTGMIVPLGMNLTLVVAPEGKIGTYMGAVSAMTTLGPALGPIVAGVVLHSFSWHALFVLFAILVAIGLVLAAIFVPDASKLTHPKLDMASVCLVSIGLIGLLYGVSTLFSGQVLVAVVAIVVGLAFLAAFVVRQNRLTEPLLDLRPFRNAMFVLGLVVVIIALMTVFSMNMVLPVFMQSSLGYSALNAALTLFPACICSCVLSPVAGRIFDKHGLRVMVPVGLACIAVFTFALSRLGEGAQAWQIIVFYLIVILGVALTMGPTQTFALSQLDRDLYPHGVTIVSTGFQIAGCLGSSLFMGVLSLTQQRAMGQGAAPAAAMASGFSASCLLATGLAIVGFVIALVIARNEHKPRGVESAAAVAVEPAAQGSLAALMKDDVYAVPADGTVLDAVELFVGKKISGAPVVAGDGKVVGFVSDGDVMRALSKQTPLFQSAWSFMVERDDSQFNTVVNKAMDAPVMQIATRDVIGVDVHDDLETVCKILADKHLKKAPVYDGGKMVGMINRSNITRLALEDYVGQGD